MVTNRKKITPKSNQSPKTLAVDMGNSNIVVGIMDCDGVVYSSRIETETNKTEMHYLMQFRQVLSEFNVDSKEIEGGILSSVVPELDSCVIIAMERLIGRKVMVLGDASIETGLEIAISDPLSLGNDRIADCIGAKEQYEEPLMVVDMGTATTINVIDKEGKYIGGMIIPGVRTSLNALSQNASQLPRIPIEAPRNFLGRTTRECMKSGIIYGFASMVDGMIERVTEQLGCQPTVIVTGGLSKLIVPYCKHNVIYDEHLLLKGLNYIYHHNKK